MLTRKTSRIIGLAMLAAAVVFLGYALTHPTASFPWSNDITFGLYAVYLAVMAVLFIAPVKKN